MIYSLQDETNSEYKHLVNSRFELFRKQDTKIPSCFLREKDIVYPGYIQGNCKFCNVTVLIGREVHIDIFMFCMTNFIRNQS